MVLESPVCKRLVDYLRKGKEMPRSNLTNLIIYFIIAVVAIAALLFLGTRLARFLNAFAKELGYLNCEIRRTEGSERKYWEKKKKELWLSLIPFVNYK